MNNDGNRILLDTNQQAIETAKRNYQSLVEPLNKVVQTFREIGIGEISDMEEINLALQRGGKNLLEEKLHAFSGGDNLKLGKVPIKKDKLAELLNIGSPKSFYATVDAAVLTRKQNSLDMEFFGYLDGKVFLQTLKLDEFLFELHSTHIDSDIGIELHDRLITFVNDWNEINALRKSVNLQPLHPSDQIRHFVSYGITSQGVYEVSINSSVFKDLAYVKDPVKPKDERKKEVEEFSVSMRTI